MAVYGGSSILEALQFIGKARVPFISGLALTPAMRPAECDPGVDVVALPKNLGYIHPRPALSAQRAHQMLTLTLRAAQLRHGDFLDLVVPHRRGRLSQRADRCYRLGRTDQLPRKSPSRWDAGSKIATAQGGAAPERLARL